VSQRPRSPRSTEDRGRNVGTDLAAQVAQYAGHGLTMALATGLFAWLGSLLDAAIGTKPVFVLLGAFLGFGGGFYSMYWRLVLRGPGSGGDAGDDDS
jgi:F0F1-type ATP synthase assembly protein I